MTARTADRLAARQQTLAASSDEAMHFTLEVRADPDPDALREAIAAAFPGVRFELTQLIPDQPPFDRFFRLAFQSAAFVEPGLNGFDVAYDLLDELDLASIDAAAPFEPPAPDEALDSSGSSSGPGDGPPPANRAWHLGHMRVREAWKFSEDAGKPDRGRGVSITYPDTGAAEHVSLRGRIQPAWNYFDNNANTTDPLNYWGNPGHGTSVGAVAVGNRQTDMCGVAPEAGLRPFRAVQVVLVRESNAWSIADSILRGVKLGSQVAAISLGSPYYERSKPPEILAKAIAHATEHGRVVVAAAGNWIYRAQTSKVTYPGWDRNVICAGNSTFANTGYDGACRGPEVTVSAPGLHVWTAWRGKPEDRVDAVGAGTGTSYSTANIAGVAALWIAHHGWQAIVAAARGPERVSALFRHIIRKTAKVPPGWNTGEYGAGVIDAFEVLKAPLDLPAAEEDAVPTVTTAERLTALLRFHGVDEAALAQVDEAFADRYGPELDWIMARRAAASAGAAGLEVAPVSETLAATFPAAAELVPA